MTVQVNKHVAADTIVFVCKMILNHDKRKIWIPEAGLIIRAAPLRKDSQLYRKVNSANCDLKKVKSKVMENRCCDQSYCASFAVPGQRCSQWFTGGAVCLHADTSPNQ